jgi:hypothetical protein
MINRTINFALAMFFGLAVVAPAQVTVTVDRVRNFNATPAFKFPHVPSPVKDNAAAKANLQLIVGKPDANSAPPNNLIGGVLPVGQDEPPKNFFFADGSDGGRILLDFGRIISISQVNTYSWHTNYRGPQVYNLFVSDGTAGGWKLIATVDTRADDDYYGGQYGVSIAGAAGDLGKFRYVLIDTVPTEIDDTHGNTFFSQINVIEAK